MTAPRCGSTQHDVIHCLVVSCNMLSGHWQYWFWSGTWQQLHNHVHSQESSRNLKYAFNLDTRVHKQDTKQQSARRGKIQVATQQLFSRSLAATKKLSAEAQKNILSVLAPRSKNSNTGK